MVGDSNHASRRGMRRRLGAGMLVAALTVPMMLRPQLWQFLTDAVLVHELLRRIRGHGGYQDLGRDAAGSKKIAVKPPVALPPPARNRRIGAQRTFDLSDAGAHQHQDHAQLRIVEHLQDLYLGSEAVSRQDVEAEFHHAFFHLAGQQAAMDGSGALLFPSATAAFDTVADLLARRNMSAALVEPCFTCMPGVHRRRGVRLSAVSESLLARIAAGRNPRNLPRWFDKTDALFVALPNDPTGFTLGPAQFKRLARYCADAGTLLIVDWTLRFFEQYESWDAYSILNQSGVSYVCVEDTGRTFPTLGLTCAILVASPDLRRTLTELHTEAAAGVSPFTLRLLTAYLRDTSQRGLETTVRRGVRANRKLLHQALRGTVLTPDRPDRAVSVEWVRIDSPTLTSRDLVEMLEGIGISVLPGEHFHWADPSAGSKHLRFALTRDHAMFEAACSELRECLRDASELTVTLP